MKGKSEFVINRTVLESEIGKGLGWKCDICGAPFKTFKAIKKHKKKDHAY